MFLLFVITLTLISDFDMVFTRNQTLAAATVGAAILSNSNPKAIVNKQIQAQTTNRRTCRTIKRSPSSSSPISSRHSRSQVAKKIFNKNNKADDVKLFT